MSGRHHTFGVLTVDGEWIHYDEASQPLAGAIAAYETAGEISQRSTFIRVATGGIRLGPAGLLAGAMHKKNIDRREFYISIDGPEQFGAAPVPRELVASARQFVAWVNTLSRLLMDAAAACTADRCGLDGCRHPDRDR